MGTPPKFRWNRGGVVVLKNFSEMGQDRTKVTIDDQQEDAYMLSIGTKINDLG